VNLSADKIIAHVTRVNYADHLHMGAPGPAALDPKRYLYVLVRDSADQGELEAIGTLGSYREDLGGRFFTISTVKDVSDDLATKLWSVTHRYGHHEGIASFREPLEGFALAKAEGRLRAFTRSHTTGYINHLLEVDLGRPWPIEDGIDLKDFFYSHINPTLGDLEVLTPEYCANYIDSTRNIQTPWPWPAESRDAFFVAVGAEIDRFLAENSVAAYGQEVILNVFVAPPPAKPATSNPMSWVFRDGLSHQLTPEFSARLQADLEAKLPDLLQRFVSNEGALKVRPDAFTHSFRKDWIPGTRLLVTIARLRSASDHAAVTS